MSDDAVRVLIIEDDERISEIHRRLTEKVPGFEVVGMAHNLAHGQEMCEVLEPDLILLDLYFPDGYGMDLLNTLRGRKQEVDLILITAAKEVEPLREAMRGGAFDYIIKPVIFSRFKESLEKYLRSRSRLAEGKALQQQEVDHLMGSPRSSKVAPDDLPKGIDPLTLEKVQGVFTKPPEEGLSAEEVGSILGVSRTTARRYMEYMVSGGLLVADLVYRKIGRPERRYFSRRRGEGSFK
jgi:two-component system CitB family response regulator/two-component system response regulator DcuR